MEVNETRNGLVTNILLNIRKSAELSCKMSLFPKKGSIPLRRLQWKKTGNGYFKDTYTV